MARLLASLGSDYAIIGAHAVNCWLEPRVTADIDVTVAADRARLDALRARFAREGFRVAREHGADAPSGPDFVRFVSADGEIVIELQAAKTAFQREVVRRAVPTPLGLRVATVEDLIVLKLIADRTKDQSDLEGLLGLGALDWAHVEKWAAAWGVFDRLQRKRRGP
ncbi:nucleotidyl transferase AbiEii/AbiGii toxin family protein [bacterium]|nr:nucleotidyl transferase AbiEii/AbiGii toxin family protein [bacterium]